MQELDEQDLDSEFIRWLSHAIDCEASDIHLVVDNPPVIRTHGKLQSIGTAALEEARIRQILEPITSPELLDRIRVTKSEDLALSLRFRGQRYRLRVNVFLSNRSINACLRIIPDQIPDFSWAGFPEDLAKRIVSFPNGLILFTGITGSGKSTSLAMILQRMNQQGGVRILTIEDPIEYLFPVCPGSIVSQREIGYDVDSFSDGLKFGLRQDPDVILVGEIRDSDTARMALSAAETGHLVFSTMHTRDAKGAISRYADMFSQSVQGEIRSQLATLLRAVVCQRLMDSILPDEKQELALEIMFNSPAIASAIRNGKLESIDNYILTGRSEGMITMDESIKRLVSEGLIGRESAERFLSSF